MILSPILKGKFCQILSSKNIVILFFYLPGQKIKKQLQKLRFCKRMHLEIGDLATKNRFIIETRKRWIVFSIYLRYARFFILYYSYGFSFFHRTEEATATRTLPMLVSFYIHPSFLFSCPRYNYEYK